jgi:hypothetical protein
MYLDNGVVNIDIRESFRGRFREQSRYLADERGKEPGSDRVELFHVSEGERA